MRCRNCGRELTLANKSNSYGLCKACKNEEDNSSYDDCDCDCHSIFNDNNDDCNCGCND